MRDHREPRDWKRLWKDPPGFFIPGCPCCSTGTCNFRKIDSSGSLQLTFLAARTAVRRIGIDTSGGYGFTWSADTTADQVGDATIEKFDFATQTVAWTRALTSLNPPTDVTNRLDFRHFEVVAADGRYYYASGTTAINYVLKSADLSNGAVWTSSINPNTYIVGKTGDFLYTYSAGGGPIRINGSTGAAIWTKFVATTNAGDIDTSDRLVNVVLNAVNQLFEFSAVATGTLTTQVITGSSIRQQNFGAINQSTNKMTVVGKDSGGTNAYVNQIPLTGTVDWETSIATGDTVNYAGTDPSGNSYIALGTKVRKYNSSGVFQWEYDHGATVWHILTDSSDNLYLGGDEAPI